jgi:hypothetical protein
VRLDQAVAWLIENTAHPIRLQYRGYAPDELEMLNADAPA